MKLILYFLIIFIGLHLVAALLMNLIALGDKLVSRRRDELARIGRQWPAFVKSFFAEVLWLTVGSSVELFGFIPLRQKNRLTLRLVGHPVLLVHGYLRNRACWALFKRRLRRGGFSQVYTVNLPTFNADIRRMAEILRDKVNEIQRGAGGAKVDLVCHSLGGVVARYYLTFLDQTGAVRKCITLGSPHKGTKLARLGLGRTIKHLAPNSELIRQLNQDESNFGEVKFYSLWSAWDDMIVPEDSPLLGGSVKNIELHGLQHHSMLYSNQTVERVREILRGD